MKTIRTLGIAGILAGAVSLETLAQESEQIQIPSLEETRDFIVNSVNNYRDVVYRYEWDILERLKRRHKSYRFHFSALEHKDDECTLIIYKGTSLHTRDYSIDPIFSIRTTISFNDVDKDSLRSDSFPGLVPPAFYIEIPAINHRNLFQVLTSDSSQQRAHIVNITGLYLPDKDVAERVKTAIAHAVDLCTPTEEDELF